MTTRAVATRTATGMPPDRRRQPVHNTSLGKVVFMFVLMILITGVGGAIVGALMAGH